MHLKFTLDNDLGTIAKKSTNLCLTLGGTIWLENLNKKLDLDNIKVFPWLFPDLKKLSFFPHFSLTVATLFFRAVKRKIDVYVADFKLR